MKDFYVDRGNLLPAYVSSYLKGMKLSVKLNTGKEYASRYRHLDIPMYLKPESMRI